KANEASGKLENAKEKNADNVHTKAEEAKEKVQDVLLSVREKLGNAKEAGEEFQKKISSSNDKQTNIKGVGNIKGASDIKSSF
ncbi:gas vesicle protein GvpQ, partial [Planococcus sp. SIMBA_143]